MSLERLLAGIDPQVARILDGALDGRELTPLDARRLLETHGPDFHALVRAADLARAEDKGDDVSFVVNRNMNFTNVCYVGCSFCGFSRHKDDPDAYDHSMDTLLAKARDAVARGAAREVGSPNLLAGAGPGARGGRCSASSSMASSCSASGP